MFLCHKVLFVLNEFYTEFLTQGRKREIQILHDTLGFDKASPDFVFAF